MADTTLDTQGGVMEQAFQDYQDNTHNASDLLNNPLYSPTQNQSIVQTLITSAKKAGSGDNFYKPDTGGWGNYGFDRQATVGNFEQGREKVPLERGQPVRNSRALQSENPQASYENWYRMMKQFAYSGK